jgi:hypothetical protein
MRELIFNSNVFRSTKYLALREMLGLVKEGLRDEDYGNIAVIATFGEQVAYLDGIHLVQEVVKDNEARSSMRVAECCR